MSIVIRPPANDGTEQADYPILSYRCIALRDIPKLAHETLNARFGRLDSQLPLRSCSGPLLTFPPRDRPRERSLLVDESQANCTRKAARRSSTRTCRSICARSLASSARLCGRDRSLRGGRAAGRGHVGNATTKRPIAFILGELTGAATAPDHSPLPIAQAYVRNSGRRGPPGCDINGAAEGGDARADEIRRRAWCVRVGD
ncbi:hypothetical protein R69749_05342 [Paraburkholderia domus]|uniref:Uncharacterized protein n=1 Tax=Paraburkholderia nemoris TaxID=2793076 RepID=A0ABN7MUJ4_9BURK|nr:hypothetical protein R69776_06219 [Paraburkholderia nemoris]CAE6835216.1 hypothetical protein R75777_06797 [Paraburkholderia nemoris]CAE6859194.1 hypothetical protein R69749_05342 [Paraburkholderia domus]